MEGATPRLEVLRGLRHFDVGIKFLQLVENGVFVIVFKIVIALLNE
jgi:hypothetical protein